VATGVPGAGGNAGSQGLGCASGFGSFVAGVWVPGSAQVGAQGAAGQRGGTGAPSGGFDTASMANMPAGVSANTTQRYRLGASGGGSGAGGCGGAGGASGGTGGASIGILVFFTGGMSLTPPTIHANVVARGLGGDGGEGGAGGRGGTGGNGGIGGNSNGFWVPFRAGNGGRGGIGGTGGGGGGGCGGASIGVAVAGLPMGATIDYLTTNTFAVPDGTPTGGGGGNAGATGATHRQRGRKPRQLAERLHPVTVSPTAPARGPGTTDPAQSPPTASSASTAAAAPHPSA
jgi:hypothetical protein